MASPTAHWCHCGFALADERGGRVRGLNAAPQLPTRTARQTEGNADHDARAHTFPPSHSPHHSKWHPDRNPDSKEKAEKKFKEVSWFERGVVVGASKK